MSRVKAGQHGSSMYYVYVLKSKRYKKFYTGFTENVEQRLKQHNSGRSSYTKRYMPWKITYTERYESRQEAIQREKYLKSAAGRRYLLNVLQLPEC